MKYYYWFPPCIFAEWPWHLNIHKPLKIKEAHLVHLACCYAQQHLPSVRSKKLSHSKVECLANSKTPLVSHMFPADCRLINICYMSCCCCSKNVIFSSDLESCIPSQHWMLHRSENKGKGRKALGFLIKFMKREPGTFLCVFFADEWGSGRRCRWNRRGAERNLSGAAFKKRN